jgi:hypothetical protein
MKGNGLKRSKLSGAAFIINTETKATQMIRKFMHLHYPHKMPLPIISTSYRTVIESVDSELYRSGNDEIKSRNSFIPNPMRCDVEVNRKWQFISIINVDTYENKFIAFISVLIINAASSVPLSHKFFISFF